MFFFVFTIFYLFLAKLLITLTNPFKFAIMYIRVKQTYCFALCVYKNLNKNKEPLENIVLLRNFEIWSENCEKR